jgi:hypothetical protein
MKNDETFLSVIESANAVAESLLEGKIDEASMYYEGMCSWYEDMCNHYIPKDQWRAKSAKAALDAIHKAIQDKNAAVALEQVRTYKEEIGKLEDSL